MPHRLTSLLGEHHIVLAFYEMAFADDWSRELRALNAARAELEACSAQVLGVSTDPLPAVGAWARETRLWFPLLSDWPENKVSRAYGVYDEGRGVARRATFVIGRDARVGAIVDGFADAGEHTAAVLSALAAFTVAPR